MVSPANGKPYRGRLVVLYGINNLGKSTQLKKLRDWLVIVKDKMVETVKYPIYDLPTGQLIDDFLRHGNPLKLSPREAQMLYALNKWHFQGNLIRLLQSNDIVLAEDYVGTGLAWGIASGVKESFMRQINDYLLTEDLALLFDGERFIKAIEEGHRHEGSNNLILRCRELFRRLGREFNWQEINANLTEEEIFKQLCEIIEKALSI